MKALEKPKTKLKIVPHEDEPKAAAKLLSYRSLQAIGDWPSVNATIKAVAKIPELRAAKVFVCGSTRFRADLVDKWILSLSREAEKGGGDA